MKIAIPSKGRSTQMKTLKMLKDQNIPVELVHVFVIADEFELYKTNHPEYQIIIGSDGVAQQRKFIENYFPAGTPIISIDDDIKSIDLSLTEYENLNAFFIAAFNDCIDNDAFVWGIYPVFNQYFRKNRENRTECLQFICSHFYGYINRPGDPDLEIQICKIGSKSDVEKSILYYKKDGIVLRYNRIGVDTQFYASGGLGSFKSRLEQAIANAKSLAEMYPEYGKLTVRKNGMHEFPLRKLKPFKKDTSIDVLDQIHPEEFSVLYEMLESILMPMVKGDKLRRGFPEHRSTGFGIIRQRKTNNLELSYFSKKYPEIHAEMVRIGDKYCPFSYTSIHTNKNTICPKHRDGSNKGKSMLVSFGEYSGCNIVVEGVKYNADCQPVVFNGADLEHENTDDLVGTKYSLVYYNAGLIDKNIV
tara:strand:- start:262 stop:1512 length:1251 start_codon:yes stop_codon:yes gene_type:complete